MIEQINDDEIRVIGPKPKPDNSGKKRTILLVGILFLIAAIVVVLVLLLMQNKNTPENNASENDIGSTSDVGTLSDEPFCVRYIFGETSKDTLFRVFEPGGAAVELLMNDDYDTNDQSILFATQAANIRAEDRGIIGDFVYKGKVKAEGYVDSTTLGFCAIYGGKVVLGKSYSTNYLDSAKNGKGYFYRHYTYVTNEGPESFSNNAKSYRRAICIMDNKKAAVVESYGRMTMSDFADALYDHNFSLAVGLMGSKNLDEWYRADSGRVVLYTNSYGPNPNRNYLIFRAK